MTLTETLHPDSHLREPLKKAFKKVKAVANKPEIKEGLERVHSLLSGLKADLREGEKTMKRLTYTKNEIHKFIKSEMRTGEIKERPEWWQAHSERLREYK